MSTFVDDPVVVAIGQSSQDRSWIFLRHLALWRALGLKLSWNKAQRGSNLVWIGFELKVESDWFHSQTCRGEEGETAVAFA